MTIIDELTAIAGTPAIFASRLDLGITFVSFNVQRWTSLINTFGGVFGIDFQTEQWDAQTHARLIARYLERYQADVVMMQEAWDCEYFLEEMEKFGYFGIGSIKTTDSLKFGIDYPLGSGLAFFSRYPIQQLGDVGNGDSEFTYTVTSSLISSAASAAGKLPTGATIRARQGWLSLHPVTGLPTIVNVPADHVAFHKFENASGIDAYASKGVAMIKIEFQGSVVTLVNTHLNAEGLATKALQFQEIDTFLRRNLAVDVKSWGHVFLAGDLNSRGDHESDHGPWDQHIQPTSDPNETLLRRHFIDTWDQFAYPPLWRQDEPTVQPARWVDRTDPGDTAGIFRLSNERSRIDYILWHPSESAAMAVAHPRVLNDAVADSGPRNGAALSDHWPYAVTLVTKDDFASPSRPLRIDGTKASVTSTQLDPRVTLFTPSSVQWFVVLEPGSYAITVLSNVPNSTVVAEVYRASNLSNHELPAPGELLNISEILDVQEVVLAPEYRWRPEPIFIKVFQGGKKGERKPNVDYTLAIVPLDGTSPARGPVVTPGVLVEWTIGTQVKIPDPSTVGEIWFKYATIGPFNESRTQVLDIHAIVLDAAAAEVHANRLAVFERTGTSVPGSLISAAQTAGGSVAPVEGFKNLRIQDSSENWKRRLVRIEIPDTVVLGQRLRFGWETDLSVVPSPPFNASQRLRLHCNRAKDGLFAGADDSIRLQLIVDGLEVYPKDQRPNLGNFDDNQSRALDHIVGCSIGYFDGIDIILNESDVFDDDTFKSEHPIEQLPPSQQGEMEFSVSVSGKSRYTLFGSVARYSPTNSSLRPGTAGPADAVECKRAEL